MGLSSLMRTLVTPRPAALPDGVHVYVVGDIHGRHDLLCNVHRKISRDIRCLEDVEEIKVIFLGDYIDRGKDSCKVIEFLVHEQIENVEYVFLKGNHEATLLTFLDNPGILEDWKSFGGLETLSSYGVDVSRISDPKAHGFIHRQFLEKLPYAHLRFFKELKPFLEIGDYFFCHAGVRPGVALEEQKEADLLWIKDEFLESSQHHGKMIVHGHSKVEQVEIWDNRINVDTGAYITGNLTCIYMNKTNKMCL